MKLEVTRKEAYKILKSLNIYYQMYNDEVNVLLTRLLDEYKNQAYYDHMNKNKL